MTTTDTPPSISSTPSGPLSGKVALITGGARGIGAGIAQQLAAKGASIAINYSSSSTAASALVSSLTSAGTRALAIQANITSLPSIFFLFEQTVSHFGHLDIVVSNSGMEKFVPLGDTTEADFDGTFALNTKAQFFVAQAALKHISPKGRLILTSSIAAGLGVPGHALYAGSKSAVEGFARCFAKDFSEKRCTVNVIAPAGVKSDMWTTNSWRYAPGCDKSSSLEDIERALAEGSPLKRCAVPEDIGKVVAFLVGEEGEWVNGQIIPLNGGASV